MSWDASSASLSAQHDAVPRVQSPENMLSALFMQTGSFCFAGNLENLLLKEDVK